MPEIIVLEKSVAELIAAGEVVDRPASVVKELVENAIDAGATDISVDISGGGVGLIRVADNGCGISRRDVPTAFLRHATSKVRRADDLDGILTLGFRGEALSSVAAMCRVELATKTAEEIEGTSYMIEGGEALSLDPVGRPTGTTITVRDIFYNTPARMKFLKKDVTEGNSVAQAVDKCALSHPEISFKFTRDGVLKRKTSGSGNLLPVIYEIYGRELAESLVPVNYKYESFAKITGFISKPSGSKPSRAYQTFFINSRFVRTRTAQAALEEAYKSKIMGGKFPACVLNIELDAGFVDVNVHPAKTEVRFLNEKPVFSAVYYAAKSTLNTLETPLLDNSKKWEKFDENVDKPAPSRLTAREYLELFAPGAAAEKPKESVFAYSENKPAIFSKPTSVNSPRLDISVTDEPDSREYMGTGGFLKNTPRKSLEETANCDKTFDNIAAKREEIATNNLEYAQKDDGTPRELEFHVIGEAFQTYAVIESGDGLLLVDKHAAHEMILYESLKSKHKAGDRQVLLTPQSVTLLSDDYAALIENLELLQQLGFLAEDFGENCIVVREVPVELQKSDIAFIIGEIADKLKKNSHDLTPNDMDRLYYSIACRSAIKSGDKTSEEELVALVKLLKENPSITHCPHGRPVFVMITAREIEKMFGRQA